MHPDRPAPLIIIGLDGAGFNLIDPMMTRGELPNLQRLAGGGLRTELLSTVPPATLPAWTSFMTASSPSVHGVTDIFMRQGYGLVPSNGTWRTLPTFLARLSAAGLNVASLGVPGTYPPEPLARGVCIAGFDAPGASEAGAKAVWPRSFNKRLRALGGWRYATFNEHARGGARKRERAVRALLHDIAAKERVVLDVYSQEPWDVFFVHLQASDTAAHHLWHTYDVNSPRHSAAVASDALLRIYQRLDTLIGKLCAIAPAHARVMVVSDHGMGGASSTAVHLNRWLHQHGLLAFKSAPLRRLHRARGALLRRTIGTLPPRLLGAMVRATPQNVSRRALAAARAPAIDFAQTLAFSDELDYAPSIWLNTRGRFEDGLVAAHAQTLREEIRRDLLMLRCPHTGHPLIKAVRLRDELAPGPHRDRFPDLLIEPAWPQGYRPSFVPSQGPGAVVETLPAARFSAPKGAGMPGVHRREGVFLLHGAGIPATEIPTLEIAQAGACVYSLMGMAVPQDADAVVPEYLREMLGGGAYGAVPDAEVGPSEPYSEEENLQLTQRLQSLGYLE